MYIINQDNVTILLIIFYLHTDVVNVSINNTRASVTHNNGSVMKSTSAPPPLISAQSLLPNHGSSTSNNAARSINATNSNVSKTIVLISIFSLYLNRYLRLNISLTIYLSVSTTSNRPDRSPHRSSGSAK